MTIAGNTITGHFTDGRNFQTYAPNDPNLVDKLNQKGVKITAKPSEDDVPSLLGVLVSWFPMLLLIAVWIFFMRQMQSGGGRAMGFGKSKAKLLTERHGRVTFDDVAGVDEAKEDLQEIVEFLRDPQKFQKLGGRIPRGALLVGPPGTGKTLLARAIAGEANVPFFTISGSDFVEMFVGVGASRVRDMFDQAKKNAPCIIFIDEIDAVGRHRGAGLGGGNDEREQTLNQLLVEMDGFEANEGIILIAATNRPDVLDPALLRPGRFDRQVVVPRPDIIGREKILKVHVRKVPLAPDVDLRVIARGTPGFSGADLANLVNEAALLAARRSKRLVTQLEFEDAKDKVMMGAERRSMVMTEEEKTLTAYHEGGHALVALHHAGVRSGAQGDHHPARPRARHGHAAARARHALLYARQAEGRHHRRHGRPRRRGDRVRLRQGHLRRRPRTSRWRRCWRAPWSRNTACPTSSGRWPMATTRKRCFSAIPSPGRRTCPTRRRPSSTRRSIASSMSPTRLRARSSRRISTICTLSRAACWNTRRCRARKSRICSRASRRCASSPPRFTPRPGPASAVPTAGRGKRPPEPEPDTGGLEPQPST